MNIIVNTIILILSVLGASHMLPGVQIASMGTAAIVALVIGLLNIFVKPVLVIMTLPINILTLGLFTFVINASIIMIASYITKGFNVENFGWAILFSIFISAISYALYKVLNN